MDYIHGYSNTEQLRLIQQAQYWREKLILKDINYQPGESLLEIGCGAGSVLGIMGDTFPDLKLAGIDLEEKQIEYATNHLR
jgi:cyclopropane fatty-acyl-phospholipid synthase-like methyltransferase